MSSCPQFLLDEPPPVPPHPARPSALLQSLFPPGVSAAELRSPADSGQLLPAEAASLGNCVDKRRQEFAAGRLCVRRAAQHLGAAAFPLPIGADRSPQWPAQVTGSITHTDGFCGAVVADRRQFLGLGIDAEVSGRVTAELWPHLFVPGEIVWLRRLRPVEQPHAATLLFAAKEAFYKCQYAFTRRYLDFLAVAIRCFEYQACWGGFAVHPQSGTGLANDPRMPLRGSFRLHGEYVLAGVAARRPEPGS